MKIAVIKNMRNKQPHLQTIIIKREGVSLGILGLIIGFVGIFAFSFLLSPLALILGIIAILKKQIIAGIFSILFALAGIATSVVLWGLLGMSALLTDHIFNFGIERGIGV